MVPSDLSPTEKYRQLLGLSETSDLSELKRRYGQLRDKFEAQLHSEDSASLDKGRKNMRLLDQAYSALAADIRGRDVSGAANEASELAASGLVVELASMRVGFQILEGGGPLIKTETRRIALFGSVSTNNVLNAKYPSGKMTIFNDHIELSCLLGSHKTPFSAIEMVDKVWYAPFSLRFKQKDDDAPTVTVFAWGLASKLKQLSHQHRLGVLLKY